MSQELVLKMQEAAKGMKEQNYTVCFKLLKDVLNKNPNHPMANRAMGVVLMRANQASDAYPFLKKATKLIPEDAESWKVLGYCCKMLEIWPESIKAFEKALTLSENNIELLEQLFEINLKLLDYNTALSLIESLLDLDSKNTVYKQDYASLLQKMEKGQEAFDVYEELVKEAGAELEIEVWLEWFKLMVLYGNQNRAYEMLKSFFHQYPESLKFMYLYGKSCILNHEIEHALVLFNKIYEHTPDDIKIVQGLSTLHRILGNMDEAKKYLQLSLNLAPLDARNLYGISHRHSFHYGDEIFTTLNNAATHMREFSNKDRTLLHYALGKAYDDVGELATAFEHYKVGGALRSEGKYQEEYKQLRTIVKLNKEKIDSSLFSNNKTKGCPDNKPVFIVGMPRSGTTLMEQVLSGLDGVYGAGELNYSQDALDGLDINGYTHDFGLPASPFREKENVTLKERGKHYIKLIESISPNESRKIVDKMPHNFQWVGQLHLILPNASIIHARRHPVETCLSAYRLHFKSGHHWSNDLKTMGMYYRLYVELMEHWKNALPEGTLLEVRYEDMVNDLETESKRLAEHIGVAWTPECMKFHTNKSTVRTASIDQVRKPIYKDSINRWRKYEPYLEPLLEEISDLVEAYETELKSDLH